MNADGLLLRATSEAVTGLAASTADVHRVRLGLEGTYEAALGGGDAESGFGMDVGGGLSYAHAGLGLSLGLTGRALVLHCGSTWWPPAASPPAPRPSTRSPSSRR